MTSWLIFLFTVIPAIEFFILIQVGTRIGAGNTLVLVILTGITGAYLARLQGFLTIQKIQTNLARGILPSEDLIDGAFILAGGILLLTPGFFTDLMGLLFLFPLSRAIFKLYLKTVLAQKIQKEKNSPFSSPSAANSDQNIIDI